MARFFDDNDNLTSEGLDYLKATRDGDRWLYGPDPGEEPFFQAWVQAGQRPETAQDFRDQFLTGGAEFWTLRNMLLHDKDGWR